MFETGGWFRAPCGPELQVLSARPPRRWHGRFRVLAGAGGCCGYRSLRSNSSRRRALALAGLDQFVERGHGFGVALIVGDALLLQDSSLLAAAVAVDGDHGGDAEPDAGGSDECCDASRFRGGFLSGSF